VLGVLGGSGLSDGFAGNSGAGGIDGEVGGDGEFCVQPIRAAAATAATTLSRVAFMFELLSKGLNINCALRRSVIRRTRAHFALGKGR
jgi:hypothetical protein